MSLLSSLLAFGPLSRTRLWLNLCLIALISLGMALTFNALIVLLALRFLRLYSTLGLRGSGYIQRTFTLTMTQPSHRMFAGTMRAHE